VRLSELSSRLNGKKVAIDDVVTSYSSRMSSHKSAWAYLLRSQLASVGINADVVVKSDSIDAYDAWLVALPMEFQGTFNLFGGASDEPAKRIKRLLTFDGEIYVLNQDMPDVGAFVNSRLGSCTSEWMSLDAASISKKCSSIQRVDVVLDSDTFVLGDSHSISAYVPGANISRNDGKTLYGVMKEGMSSYIPPNISHLVSYFGNIDVRHHLCRQPDPEKATEKLVQDYIEHLKALNIPRVTVVQLLPIEHEERRIPKTGWYKKSPFYGSREKRSHLVEIFNEKLSIYLRESGVEMMKWPSEWYKIDPKVYADQYMEKPGSVHLSREYYQYDFETGKKNNKIMVKQALF
jgi:hypothetical protein